MINICIQDNWMQDSFSHNKQASLIMVLTFLGSSSVKKKYIEYALQNNLFTVFARVHILYKKAFSGDKHPSIQ